MLPEKGINNHSFSKRRKKKKFNKVFILLIVLVYIVSRTSPILTENSNHFHTITHGALEDSISFEGIILREEKVLTNSSRGLMVESKERVAKGQRITNTLESPGSGVIVKNRDGFEDKLNFQGVTQNPQGHQDTLEELLELQEHPREDGIRLISGYHWGALGSVSIEEAKEIQVGQRIWIQAQENRVRGRIIWIQESDEPDGSLILIQSSEYLEGIYDSRKLEFTLIKKTVEGLSVPIDAVYYQQDTAYVTRRTAGKNQEVPVNVLLADEERAILSGNQFRDSDGEVQHTVSLYDEVLLNQRRSLGEEGPDE